MIDLVFRAFSRARWITVATARNIYDADGNVMPGFAVDEIGAVALDSLDPPTMDTWFWVNLRILGSNDDDTLYPGEVEDGFRFTKSKLAKFVRNQATLVNLTYRGQTVRTYQFGAAANRIQLIDPRDYHTIRCREWLGGMSF